MAAASQTVLTIKNHSFIFGDHQQLAAQVLKFPHCHFQFMALTAQQLAYSVHFSTPLQELAKLAQQVHLQTMATL